MMAKTLLITVFILIIGYLGAALVSARKVAQARDAYPAEGQFIDINGSRLHYVEAGDGPPILLLHGAGGNLRDMTYGLMPALADQHLVIAFDRPGHGFSDRFDRSGIPLTDQADLFAGALQALGVNEVIIAGYSFGGSVALALAVRHPDLVKGLVAISAPSHPWPSKRLSPVNEFAALPVIGPAFCTLLNAIGTETFFRGRYAGIFAPQPAPEAVLDHVGIGLSLDPKVFVNNSRQLSKFYGEIVDLSPQYANLTLPIELIHGTADQSVPHTLHSDVFAAKYPDVTYTKIDGMGHGTHILSQDAILAAIARLSSK